MAITLNDVLGVLAAAGLTSAVVTGLIVALGKDWLSEKLRARIKSEYDEKLETHKAQLKAQGDVETERLKSQLSIAAAERQIRFAKLHERRGEVIAGTYASLSELLVALGAYVAIFEPAGIAPREERRRAAGEAGVKFSELFRTTKIFLPRATADQVDKIYQELRGIHIDFMYGVEANKNSDVTKWLDVHKKVEQLAKVAFAELEDNLRELLGDTPPTKSGAVAGSSAEPSH